MQIRFFWLHDQPTTDFVTKTTESQPFIFLAQPRNRKRKVSPKQGSQDYMKATTIKSWTRRAEASRNVPVCMSKIVENSEKEIPDRMLVTEIHQESRLRKQRPSVLCVKRHFFSSWLLVVEDFAISIYTGSQ